jgi:stage II sporulation protein Q
MVDEVMIMKKEEKNISSQFLKWKRMTKKRWFYPALYLALSAILISTVAWYQVSGTNVAKKKSGYDFKEHSIFSSKGADDQAVEVGKSVENLKLPVKNPDEFVIKTPFYDNNSTAEEQEAALVQYNNTFNPNQGIDLALNKKSFDVLAAMSGKVSMVKEDAFLGNVVEIQHDKGLVTQYQSLKDINVKVGQVVKQGDVIATAGKSVLNEDAGVHVHFELRKDNVALNPSTYVHKSLTEIKKAAATQAVDKNSAHDKKKDVSNQESSSLKESSSSSNS